MKLNPSVTHSFSMLLLIVLLFAGCGEEETTVPEIATVKINFTLPSPPTPTEPVCKTGDILQPGESCFYSGTDIEIFILDDGMLTLLNRGVRNTMGRCLPCWRGFLTSPAALPFC